jgi:PAS domain S-box-containing protein
MVAEARTTDALSSVHLGDVLERITDGIFALDAEWRIVYINSRARDLLGAHGRSLLGENFLEAFPRASDAAFVTAMAEQRPRAFVERSRTVDRWFEVQVYPSPNGLSVYFRDVTERVEAERELAERAQQQEALIEFGRIALGRIATSRLMNDALELLLTYLDLPYAEVYVYDASLRRYRFGEVAGLGDMLAPHDVPPLTDEAVAELLAGRAIFSEDVGADERFTDRETLLRIGVAAANCIPVGTEGAPLALVVLYGSRAAIASAPRRRFANGVATTLGEALRAKNARQRSREILASINDAFVACDADLRITYVNDRMAQFWQMRPEDLIGMQLQEFARRSEDADVIASYRAAIESHKSSSFETFMPDRQRWFETRVYPFSGGVAGYVRDITRRKSAELQIRELNVELEQRVRERTNQLEIANADLESFSYSVSHDLRAPLRAIDGFSQALEEDYAARLDGEGLRYLARVRSAAKRMSDLIDSLLELARIARRPMSYVPVDISRIALGIVEDMRREEDRDVRVMVENGLHAYGEPALLRASLENLIGNAWKFTRGTAEPEIHIGSAGPGTFFVRDNGAGFDMAYANKLFGAFQRLHSPEEFEGTGVGLATVARIMSRHGGTISGEGSVGLGATFTFTLPTEAPERQ